MPSSGSGIFLIMWAIAITWRLSVMWAIAITWRPSSSYVVNFLKIFSSESTRPMETKLGQNHH